MDYDVIKKCDTEVGCTESCYRDINVSVPITIKPFGEVGNAKAECLGNATIVEKFEPCNKKHDEVCKFTITQKLRVEVPVIFGARAEAGDACVDCDEKDC